MKFITIPYIYHEITIILLVNKLTSNIVSIIISHVIPGDGFVEVPLITDNHLPSISVESCDLERNRLVYSQKLCTCLKSEFSFYINITSITCVTLTSSNVFLTNILFELLISSPKCPGYNIKLNLVLEFEECTVPLHYLCFQVHSDLEW